MNMGTTCPSLSSSSPIARLVGAARPRRPLRPPLRTPHCARHARRRAPALASRRAPRAPDWRGTGRLTNFRRRLARCARALARPSCRRRRSSGSLGARPLGRSLRLVQLGLGGLARPACWRLPERAGDLGLVVLLLDRLDRGCARRRAAACAAPRTRWFWGWRRLLLLDFLVGLLGRPLASPRGRSWRGCVLGDRRFGRRAGRSAHRGRGLLGRLGAVARRAPQRRPVVVDHTFRLACRFGAGGRGRDEGRGAWCRERRGGGAQRQRRRGW